MRPYKTSSVLRLDFLSLEILSEKLSSDTAAKTIYIKTLKLTYLLQYACIKYDLIPGPPCLASALKIGHRAKFDDKVSN